MDQDELNSFAMDGSGWIEEVCHGWIWMDWTGLPWMDLDGLNRFAMDGSGWID